MKNILAMLLLSLISWGVNAQQHQHANHGPDMKMDPVFENIPLGEAYTHYIHLKDALVASQYLQSQNASVELVSSLQAVDNGDKAKIAAEKVVSASSLDEQRKAFGSLSNEMAKLVTEVQISMGQVYLEYCPMAMDNSGGYWLSNEMDIKNPYFGDKMLNCGVVKETIN